MPRRYRVRRSTTTSRQVERPPLDPVDSGKAEIGTHSTRRGRRGRKEAESRKPRWPWFLLCLLAAIFVVSIGISSAKPAGDGFLVTASSSLARLVSGLAGSFSMFFCFILMLSSLVKIVRPDEPLPRFIWGLWNILAFGSALYHAAEVPWASTFLAAKTGGGGGMIGASISWFLHVALTGPGSFVAMGIGVIVGGSMLIGKSPWAPFAFGWLEVMSLWQWFKDLMAGFFKEHGPNPEDIEIEAPKREDEDITLDELVDGSQEREGRAAETDDSSSFAAAVSHLKRKLAEHAIKDSGATKETAAGAEPEGAAAGSFGARGSSLVTPADLSPWASSLASHAAAPLTGQTRSDEAAPPQEESLPEFSTSMSQPPLDEDLFYEFPPLDILQKSEAPKRTQRAKEDINGLSRVIEKTLLSFGVVAKVVAVDQGPAVTRFELQPGPGVKVASVVNLSQDLALALAAQDVRIEAPIPGKSAIGIEVPNKEVSLVHLRDVLESREFRNSKSPLTIALGKDVSGRPVVTTLDHCLHLLIAGATGAGKSVCINSMISSLLYKARPDQVKLVLIDPKRVELSVWSRIPHLIAPVVSDPKKAAGALRWSIKEMESRYEKFTKVGTRDIERYNQVATPTGSAKPAMPYIVIIIDELSDLMMVAPAEVEDAIFRLAQMARAAGIYLVVATQRPSVDVITGTIKANIPSRIAFAVASQIDSRTILDMTGAEKLLGRGDMLFSPVGSTKPHRAQGCYISEREIDELVSFVSAQAKPQFAPGILSVPETPENDVEVQDDPFFPQALRIVVEAKQASVSLLQRKLPIGYSRAARLIDAMEVKGYVGPYEGSKPREVRLSIQEYMRLFEGPGLTAAGTSSGPSPDPSASADMLRTEFGGIGPSQDHGRILEEPSSPMAGSSRQDKSMLTKPSFLSKWTPPPGGAKYDDPDEDDSEKPAQRPARRSRHYPRHDREWH